MFLSNCPRCDETFRIPTGQLPSDAQAKCPWCHEIFPLAEVLNALPPALEVVNALGEPIEIADPVQSPGMVHPPNPVTDRLTSAAAISDDEIFEPIDLNDDPAPMDAFTAEQYVADETFGFDDIDDSEQQQEDFAPMHARRPIGDEMAPMKVMPVPVRRRKKGSGIRTAIGVVLGGVAALPIAGGLLMAVGRTPDWGFWPFDGGTDSSSEVAAAPPVDLETRNRRPLGLPFVMPDSEMTENDDQDPRSSALDEILRGSSSPSTEPDLNSGSLSSPSFESTSPVGQPPSELTEPSPGDTSSANSPGTTALETTNSEATNIAENDPLDDPFELPEMTADSSDSSVDDFDSLASPTELPEIPDPFSGGEDPTESTDSTIADASTTNDVAEKSDEPGEPMEAITPIPDTPASEDIVVSPPPSADDTGQPDSDPLLEPLESGSDSVTSNTESPADVVASPEETMTAQTVSNSNALRDAPQVIADAAEAGELVAQMSSFKGSAKERRDLLRRTYLSIAEACHHAPKQSDAIRQLASRFTDPSIINEIEDAGLDWMRYDRRPSQGVVLVGQTGEGDQAARLSLKSGKTVALSGSDSLPASSRVLAFGKIVDDDLVELVLAQPVPSSD